MKTTIKKRLLITSIAVLILLNITALSVIIFHIPSPPPPPPVEQGPAFKENRMPPEGRIRYFIRKELNFTDEQIKQFSESKRKTMRKQFKVKNQLKSLRRQMMLEIAKDEPDRDKLNEITSEIGQAHKEIKDLTIAHFLEIKTICTKEQQKKLYRLWNRMAPPPERLRNVEELRRKWRMNRNR